MVIRQLPKIRNRVAWVGLAVCLLVVSGNATGAVLCIGLSCQKALKGDDHCSCRGKSHAQYQESPAAKGLHALSANHHCCSCKDIALALDMALESSNDSRGFLCKHPAHMGVLPMDVAGLCDSLVAAETNKQPSVFEAPPPISPLAFLSSIVLLI